MAQIILIAGPTASGKSALAVQLAEQLRGVIINADSMQVYRDLRIITARPTSDEERRVPHRLYGHVDAAENYSVGRWFVEAADALAEPLQQGQSAIVVGGTGLYFSTLTRGIAAVPPIPAEIRRQVRDRLAAEGIEKLQAELAARDPAAAARLKPADRARITRALEVVLATGRSLTDWHGDNKPARVNIARAAKIFLMPDRDELGRRIDPPVEPVRHPRLFLGGRTRRDDAQVAVDLHGIGVNDDTAQLFGQRQRQRRFAARRRTGNEDDFGFAHSLDVLRFSTN